LAGPNLLILKTESFCHLFEVLLVYKTWFGLMQLRSPPFDYPQIKFPRPLLTLSQLQGHETLGVFLLLVVSLHSKACWAKDSPDSNSFGRSNLLIPKT
jgi:hypothetical protein